MIYSISMRIFVLEFLICIQIIYKKYIMAYKYSHVKLFDVLRILSDHDGEEMKNLLTLSVKMTPHFQI